MKDEEMEKMNNKMTISFNKGVEKKMLKTPKDNLT
jgi:hypothetical protein